MLLARFYDLVSARCVDLDSIVLNGLRALMRRADHCCAGSTRVYLHNWKSCRSFLDACIESVNRL